ncbi:MAG: hypothetical protein E6J60_03890 [Deltaproteobacteria bacterium]|nr:MAG: hypothetical protein E6J60_03890 [Deltaproteobacteria bacterium]
MRARGASLAALLVAQAVPAAAAPQILLRSGDATADGLRLGEAIVATGATVIVQVELTGASAGQVLLAVPESGP